MISLDRQQNTGDAFDSVLYINVLEHVQDDRTDLVNARVALRPMGHLLLFVPALTRLYSNHAREIGHFRRYTRQRLERLVDDVGLTIAKVLIRQGCSTTDEIDRTAAPPTYWERPPVDS